MVGPGDLLGHGPFVRIQAGPEAQSAKENRFIEQALRRKHAVDFGSTHHELSAEGQGSHQLFYA
eukprot:scaffold395_cov243-Pinguiococcus_pyrenoidosus.AAC.24